MPSRAGTCESASIAAATDHSALQADREAFVRELWAVYAREGVEAMRALTSPDVDWVPWSGGGEVLHGFDALSDWSAHEDIKATVHTIESQGDCVVVSGSLRVFRAGGFLDVQPLWVYFFHGTDLVRAVGYATRDEATAAIRDHSAA